MSILYDNIERLMKENGINSIFQLSKMAYVSYSCLNDLKNGVRDNLSTKNIMKIAKLFDVTIDELTSTKKESAEADPNQKLFDSIKTLSEENKAKLSDYIDLLLTAQGNQ